MFHEALSIVAANSLILFLILSSAIKGLQQPGLTTFWEYGGPIFYGLLSVFHAMLYLARNRGCRSMGVGHTATIHPYATFPETPEILLLISRSNSQLYSQQARSLGRVAANAKFQTRGRLFPVSLKGRISFSRLHGPDYWNIKEQGTWFSKSYRNTPCTTKKIRYMALFGQGSGASTRLHCGGRGSLAKRTTC